MLIQGQKFEMRWINFNREWYESKGYTFTNWGDTFWVDVNDLPHTFKLKKVKFICDKCKEIYATDYYSSSKSREKYGADLCPKCKKEKSIENNRHKKSLIRYKQIVELCEKDGYKIISREDEFYNVKKKFKFICSKHGEQEIVIDTFLRGARCYWCGRESVGSHNRSDLDCVEAKINSINENILLNKNEYVSRDAWNLKIKCGNCGRTFITSLSNYERGKNMCDVCSKSISKNELKIKILLEDCHIAFEQEKTFSDCKDKYPLPFDFYLSNYNLIIEYDGEGHYLEGFYVNRSENPAEALEYTQYHDRIKNQYCKDNNINLLRIPYWEKDNIEHIILDNLKLYGYKKEK